MGRKSSITRLPEEIRAHIDRMIRDGSSTIDEIVAEVRSLGGDVKRTAVGEYKRKMETRLAKYLEAQEVAGTWVRGLGENPDSKTGQLLAELLKTVAFRTLADLQEQEAGAEPGELMLLSRALKDMASAQKTDFEFRQKVRAEFVAEIQAKADSAAGAVEKEARSAGLTDEAAKKMREIVLGVVG